MSSSGSEREKSAGLPPGKDTAQPEVPAGSSCPDLVAEGETSGLVTSDHEQAVRPRGEVGRTVPPRDGGAWLRRTSFAHAPSSEPVPQVGSSSSGEGGPASRAGASALDTQVDQGARRLALERVCGHPRRRSRPAWVGGPAALYLAPGAPSSARPGGALGEESGLEPVAQIPVRHSCACRGDSQAPCAAREPSGTPAWGIMPRYGCRSLGGLAGERHPRVSRGRKRWPPSARMGI